MLGARQMDIRDVDPGVGEQGADLADHSRHVHALHEQELALRPELQPAAADAHPPRGAPPARPPTPGPPMSPTNRRLPGGRTSSRKPPMRTTRGSRSPSRAPSSST